jgi:hypothetical protein
MTVGASLVILASLVLYAIGAVLALTCGRRVARVPAQWDG